VAVPVITKQSSTAALQNVLNLICEVVNVHLKLLAKVFEKNSQDWLSSPEQFSSCL
jgi:Tat protein secretion system quality control protein TatD with DNase activity